MVDIRRAEPDELDAVGRLTVAAYVTDGILAPGHWYADELRDAASRAADATVLVAVDGDRVIGTITLAAAGTPWAEVAEAGEHEIRMLAVDPSARGTGVGAALVRASMRHARAAGAHRLVLTTIEQMATAQRLYRRLGMVRVPERDWHVEAGAALVFMADLVGRPGPAVEAATWVPLHVEEIGPWRVGTSQGFTRRANSAILLGAPERAEPALAEVEAHYARARQAAIVRVGTDRSPEPVPADLAATLDASGYRPVSTTRVLSRSTEMAPGRLELPDGVRLEVADAPDGDWLAGWLGTKARTAGHVTVPTALALLTGSPARYLTARDADGVVGVVRAAPVDDWVAVSCLAVEPRARRRGLGAALTGAALRSAPAARRAFLQVEVANSSALALYAGLGFVEVDEVHYRER